MSTRRANGEGSVYKTKQGYRSQLVVGTKLDGTYIRKSFSGKTKSEVLDKMQKYKYENQHIIHGEENNLTLEQWYSTWLYEFRSNELSYGSMERYDNIFRNYIKGSLLGRKKIEKLTTLDLQKYFNLLIKEEKTSINNAHTIKTVLNACLNFAEKNDLILRNPCKNVSLPSNKKANKKEALSKEEQYTIISALKPEKVTDIGILLGFTTGLRLGELRGLKWEDINFLESKLQVKRQLKSFYKIEEGKRIYTTEFLPPKTEKSKRTVPVPTTTLEGLKIWKNIQNQNKMKYRDVYQENELVLTNELGEYLENKKLPRRLSYLCKKNNIKKTNFHITRHSYATRLFELNISPKIIQELLGHESLATTMDIYTTVTEDVKKESIERLNVELQAIL